MPSVLKARTGKPSVMEMRADLDKLRKPTARQMEQLFQKYFKLCLITEPKMKEIEVNEPQINWKALIMSLPPPQNRTVLGCGIRKILLREAECVYEGIYRFHVVHRDGSSIVFDWRDAYDDAYHNYKEKSFKDDVETALRAAVLPQLVEYKEMLSKESQMELSSHISGLAVPWERAVVQHYPVTFEMLVDAFLNEMNLKMEHIQLEYCDQHAYKMKDSLLEERWQIYHKNQASYRIISVDEAMEQDHL
eukprot:gnl/TRDRNA2_/TRDRNA2_56151_c0_seq1.p1 gnl/TRDRNA2_/TRDRNA2_56151_c0~~gnl/TRDRNA2_/TRDRNA2_56151_c0_seq1.p1  ORF type:complete len:275 (+),score=69.95 gnl/TRDRNA2_/TRDRNA2_56151_c0_seq1:83-826(+)